LAILIKGPDGPFKKKCVRRTCASLKQKEKEERGNVSFCVAERRDKGGEGDFSFPYIQKL
jgi:hypothetical protein